jgi:hypothetical protein
MLVAFMLCISHSAMAAETVRIGALFPFTGSLALKDEGDVVENLHLSFECFLGMRKLYLVKADWTLLHGIGDLGSE